jgi:hypothetical protein
MGKTAAQNNEVDTIRHMYEQEKRDMTKVIEKKNVEINEFRVELEAILKEMEVLKMHQKSKSQKY